jgi:hypothetical protein
MGIVTPTATYPLRKANEAPTDLQAARVNGAALLIP